MKTATERLAAVAQAATARSAKAISFTSVTVGPEGSGSALPPDDPRIVCVPVTGEADGTILIAIGDEFADRMMYTSKVEEVALAVVDMLDAMTASLSPLGELEYGEPSEIDADKVPKADLAAVAGGLFNDGDHVISILFALTVPEPAPEIDARGNDRNLKGVVRNGQSNAQTDATHERLGRLASIEVELTAVLGETSLSLADLLAWLPGSIVLLNRQVGVPADLRVDDLVVGRGDIVVSNERYALRVNELATNSAPSDSLVISSS